MTWDGSALDVDGDITYTGALTDLSDRRLKTGLIPLSGDTVLNKLSGLNTYSYNMVSDPEGRREMGVMAQELEEIFPELVLTANDEIQTKSVNYIGLIAPLIEANKALHDLNNGLVKGRAVLVP